MSLSETQPTPSAEIKTGRFASFVGALPGPRTGMTYSTEQVVEKLRSSCSLREYDLGGRFGQSRRLWRVKKLLVCVAATIAILSWRRRGQESIYMVVNSRAGLIYNIMHVAAARLRGFRCVLHHHVVTYIEVPDPKMRLLLRIARHDTKHVMACQQMIDDFNRAYNTRVVSMIVPPLVVDYIAERNEIDDSVSSNGDSSSQGFVIGHLSNLSMCKGLREVILTFEEVAATDNRIRLEVAGPCYGSAEKQLIASAMTKYPGRIAYRGAIYGDEKAKFFNEIDGFLFPSKVDSWGIVLNEALVFGVPAISVRRACIPCLIGDGGITIPSDKEFSLLAAAQIRRWISDPASYHKSSEAASHQGRHLKLVSEAAMQSLVREITGVDHTATELATDG